MVDTFPLILLSQLMNDMEVCVIAEDWYVTAYEVYVFACPVYCIVTEHKYILEVQSLGFRYQDAQRRQDLINKIIARLYLFEYGTHNNIRFRATEIRYV